MKRAGLLLGVMGITLVLFSLQAVWGQSSISIDLQGPSTIQAADAWEAQLEIMEAQAGETVEASVFNGLYRHTDSLVLGTGGVAHWQIPEGVLTQSGTSLLLIRYQDTELRQTLRVLPQPAQTVDLLTTSNNLPAYGDARAMLIALPRDAWGNPPTGDISVSAAVQFPDGSANRLDFSYTSGLAWTWMRSQGASGRVRFHIQVQEAVTSLELMQTPGRPAELTLSISPNCTLTDGRDQITLIADVVDSHGSAVANGTQIAFVWEGGTGKGAAVDGRASVRIPAPTLAGSYHFYAESAGARSQDEVLRIVEQNCSS